MKKKCTFVHLRGDMGHKFSAELNRLEKEIGWYKLVAKTFEAENEQKYIPLECNLPVKYKMVMPVQN